MTGRGFSPIFFVATNRNDANDIAIWAGDDRHGWPVRGFPSLSQPKYFN
jgi:hypothetical protein